MFLKLLGPSGKRDILTRQELSFSDFRHIQRGKTWSG